MGIAMDLDDYDHGILSDDEQMETEMMMADDADWLPSETQSGAADHERGVLPWNEPSPVPKLFEDHTPLGAVRCRVRVPERTHRWLDSMTLHDVKELRP